MCICSTQQQNIRSHFDGDKEIRFAGLKILTFSTFCDSLSLPWDELKCKPIIYLGKDHLKSDGEVMVAGKNGARERDTREESERQPKRSKKIVVSVVILFSQRTTLNFLKSTASIL